jgi:5'-3' exoribonuclease 1
MLYIEHKIMEYIRWARAQPNYDPNTRHCLYGLDADLIMLGLITHDPHFCLLREEVVFGPPSAAQKAKASGGTVDPSKQNFYLLHLSLFREYLSLDFSQHPRALQATQKRPFGAWEECVIDDFIMLSLFVGNVSYFICGGFLLFQDFLPNLPGLHINDGSSKALFE